MEFKFDINSIDNVDGLLELSNNYEKISNSFLDDLQTLRSTYERKNHILKDLNVLKSENLILDFDSSKIDINTKFSLYKMVNEPNDKNSLDNNLSPLTEPNTSSKMKYVCSLSVPNKALVDNGLKELIIKYLEKELDEVNKTIDELKNKILNNY